MQNLFPIAYLPPVSYVAACIHPRKIILEKHEHYVKQTLRNRTLICGANGILPLIIPVQHKNLFTIPIHEVKISYDVPWQKIHWRSIVSAYRNSSFFEYFEDDFAPFYQRETETLYEFNLGLINTVLRILHADVTIQFTGSYEEEAPGMNDLRHAFHWSNNPSAKSETSKNRYRQVFSERLGFIPGLSILDLLFNEGGKSMDYLSSNYQ